MSHSADVAESDVATSNGKACLAAPCGENGAAVNGKVKNKAPNAQVEPRRAYRLTAPVPPRIQIRRRHSSVIVILNGMSDTPRKI